MFQMLLETVQRPKFLTVHLFKGPHKGLGKGESIKEKEMVNKRGTGKAVQGRVSLGRRVRNYKFSKSYLDQLLLFIRTDVILLLHLPFGKTAPILTENPG